MLYRFGRLDATQFGQPYRADTVYKQGDTGGFKTDCLLRVSGYDQGHSRRNGNQPDMEFFRYSPLSEEMASLFRSQENYITNARTHDDKYEEVSHTAIDIGFNVRLLIKCVNEENAPELIGKGAAHPYPVTARRKYFL